MAEKAYMARVNRLKDRVLNTHPEMDLENAVLLTRGFQESEGEPFVVQKAHAFRKQCSEKTVKIWDDELIVGTAGSKQRAGLLCADTCWSVLDDELDTINQREYDPFHLTDEDRKNFVEIIRPYWKGRSTFEKWMVQIPEEAKILRDCGVLYINRKDLQPLQILLRNLLVAGVSSEETLTATASGAASFAVTDRTMRAGTIVVATLPILIVYPFVQRFFVKGVMIGSVKG